MAVVIPHSREDLSSQVVLLNEPLTPKNIQDIKKRGLITIQAEVLRTIHYSGMSITFSYQPAPRRGVGNLGKRREASKDLGLVLRWRGEGRGGNSRVFRTHV